MSKESDLELYLLDIIIVFVLLNIILTLYRFIIFHCSKKIQSVNYYYRFGQILSYFSILYPASVFGIQFFYFCHLYHAFVRAYFFAGIYLLLRGYIIFNIKTNNKKFYISHFLFFLYESIIFSICLFTPFLFRSIKTLYLVVIKMFIEGIGIIFFTIYIFKEKYILLYRRYQLEQKKKTIYLVILSQKISYYFKIVLFSFIYGIGNFILPIITLSIQNNTKFHLEDVKFCYYMIILFELLFVNVYTIMFYPKTFSILLFYPFKLETILRTGYISQFNENNDNISRLTKNELKNIYQKNNYPIVLFKPFCDEYEFFSHLNIGYVSST